MATGANTTPLGRLNPILAARQTQMQAQMTTGMMPAQGQRAQSHLDSSSRQSLTAHIEAAKRAAAGKFTFSLFCAMDTQVDDL